MMSITTAENGAHIMDVEQLWKEIDRRRVPQEERLSTILDLLGVEFHDPKTWGKNYVKSPKVFLRSFNGQALHIKDGITCVGAGGSGLGQSLAQSEEFMGYAAMDSYLNPRDKSSREMFKITCDLHGIPSTAHMVHLGIYVAGLSLKAELELNCQRDIVHLSRLTSAKTKAQDAPPILVEDERMLPLFNSMKFYIQGNRDDFPEVGREAYNSAFPLAKCSALGITGSLKNLYKLAALEADEGKEDEVRLICRDIGYLLDSLYPQFENVRHT